MLIKIILKYFKNLIKLLKDFYMIFQSRFN
jgi:hypothetical protein